MIVLENSTTKTRTYFQNETYINYHFPFSWDLFYLFFDQLAIFLGMAYQPLGTSGPIIVAHSGGIGYGIVAHYQLCEEKFNTST